MHNLQKLGTKQTIQYPWYKQLKSVTHFINTLYVRHNMFCLLKSRTVNIQGFSAVLSVGFEKCNRNSQ